MTARSLLRRATGMDLSPAVAERAVRQRMACRALSDLDLYLRELTPDELSQLIELVIVPESWLFRDPQAFAFAVELVRARRPGAARPARILSIPCASGEEAYSMAMALRDAGVPADAFSIDAVDLSHACIARARRGIYGRNAFRTTELGFRTRYFTPLGGGEYRIDDALRAQVAFRQGNLLEFDTASHAHYYDLIFCRNLLIYFDQPTASAAAAKLAAMLADDGVLFAGYAEMPAFCQNGYTALPQRHVFALKKSLALPQVAPAPPKPARAAPTLREAPAAPSLAPPPAAPAPAEDLLQQARRLADLGQFQQAGEKCRAHLAVAPDAADAHFILGILNEQAGQPAAAEQCWRRCIYLQPDHYDALCHLALLAEHSGNGAGAAALKQRAARIFQRRRTS